MGSCFVNNFLLFRIAQKFKDFMVYWSNTESYFSCDKYKTLCNTKAWNLRKKICRAATAYLILSALEHLFYLGSEINKLVHDIRLCAKWEVNYFEVFIKRHIGFVVNNFEYNHALGLFFEYLNVSYTFCWNFLDLFIIVLSLGIAFLFEKINCRIEHFRASVVKENVWAEIRYHHVKVCELLYYTNGLVGKTVAFTCFVDGYFILVQFLNISK